MKKETYKKIYETIELSMIEKYGVGFLALSKEKQSAMITETIIEYLKSQRERQA